MHPVVKSAILSPQSVHRYGLSRHWGPGPIVAWIMLNPSTADAEVDDPTIRKCMKFSVRWGMGGMIVGNLFAFRTAYPKILKSALDPVGPENERYIKGIALAARDSGGFTVCGWGNDGAMMGQDRRVVGWLTAMGIRPKCLHMNKKTGMPQHPLYVRDDVQPIYYIEV